MIWVTACRAVPVDPSLIERPDLRHFGVGVRWGNCDRDRRPVAKSPRTYVRVRFPLTYREGRTGPD